MGKSVSDNGAGAAAQTSAAAGSNLANIQGNISQLLYNNTDPLRQALFSRFNWDPQVWNKALAGPVTSSSVAQSPLYPLLKQTAEQQYKIANDQAFANQPSGGALASALQDNSRDRANAMITGTAAIGQDFQNYNTGMLDRAFQLATGVPAVSLSGLGSASGTLGQLQASQAAQAAQASSATAGKNASLGQGLGTLGAAAIKK
jgi:hypothetical protein